MTQLLVASRDGNPDAVARLMPVIYNELHALAARHLRGQPPGQSLQATLLVHEAFLRLIDQTKAVADDRAHFLAVASKAMRSVIIDHVRRRKAQKRGGDRRRVPLDEAVAAYEARSGDLIALDEALTQLAATDEQQSHIVELRFFGGLSVEETAEIIGVSKRTVERDWRMARAWLRNRLSQGEPRE
ncbi:MAG: sigma-70 family RNA polymerase sigma factor [Phycisphaerae bacterium]